MRSIGKSAGAIFTVAFDRAADRLAAGGADGAIRVWDVRKVPPAGGDVPPDTVRKNAHEDGVKSVVFSPKDDFVASGGADKTVRLWNSGNLTPVEQWPTAAAEGHTATVTSVSFSADGTRLVSGSDDMTVRLWDVEEKRRIGDPLIGHQGQASASQLSATKSSVAETNAHYGSGTLLSANLIQHLLAAAIRIR